eukprot:CAMPEP_0178944774 /NCGR_PEP_ID=MMETSP0789-20121207/3349_1 /TAXON_ID=3005 /ORGANISM="Rhizosolenia setigera, Strain CCMP 1694" /LENGTH=204 /DNA_ID=CAMNT_0020624557 /DNA_START=115 /DNA_END=729 /DNA_ORIENTATION=-
MYGEPDWTTPSTPGAGTTVESGAAEQFSQTVASQNTGLSPTEAKQDNANCAQVLLSILNFAICGLMAFLASEAILTLNWSGGAAVFDISTFFVAIYMITFALLLLAYEIMWWKTIDSVNFLLRKNFGFLYGIRGKGFYIIFVAFLCLGLEADDQLEILMYTTGAFWLLSGILHIFVYFWRPHLVDTYQAPTKGLSKTGGDSDII